MKICPYCKNENEVSNKYCNYCGAPFENETAKTEETSIEPAASFEPAEYQPEQESDPPAVEESGYPAYDSAGMNGQNRPVEPVPIGGLVAWSIFVVLFCTIPGIVALFYVLRINRAATVEEQMKTMDTAKKILIAGTALAVFNLITQIAVNM